MKLNKSVETYNRFIEKATTSGHPHIYAAFTQLPNRELGAMVPLYDNTVPASQLLVSYALKPLSQNPTIHTVTVAEFCKVAGLESFEWTNTIYLPKNVKTFVQNNPIEGIDPLQEAADCNRTEIVSSIYSDVKKCNLLHQQFVICKIDEVANWGVFANIDMPANSFIGLYAGELTAVDLTRDQNNAYRMEVRHKIFDSSPTMQAEGMGQISALSRGNITRFFNAMPTREQLKECQITPKKRGENSAVANCVYQMGVVNGVPAQTVVTKRNIRKGEQLGLPYWQSNHRFGLFDKHSGLLLKDVKIEFAHQPEEAKVLIELYLPETGKRHRLILKPHDFIQAVTKNHLSMPNNKAIPLLHSDYIQFFAQTMSVQDLQLLAGNRWAEVKLYMKEFKTFNEKQTANLLCIFKEITGLKGWKLSPEGNFNHFEVKTTPDMAHGLVKAFSSIKFGFISSVDKGENTILHWHENPWQDAIDFVGLLPQAILEAFTGAELVSTLGKSQ